LRKITTILARPHVRSCINFFLFFQGGKTPEKRNEGGAASSVASTTSQVTPSRYNAIASLDEALTNEDENWQERTSIITKIDHDLNLKYAQEFVLKAADSAVSLAR